MSNEFKPRNGLIIPTETASTVPYLDANKKLVSSDVTPTELDYLDGVTSNIQTQLDAKASIAAPTFTTNITTPLVIGGTSASSTLSLQSTSGVGTTDAILFKVGNNGATTAMIVGTAGRVGIGRTATTNSLEVSTAASINGSAGVSLNFAGGTGINYIYYDDQLSINKNGAGAAIDIDASRNVTVTGNILNSALTASRAMVTDESKKLTSSATTATELGYLSGVTGAVQTQIDTKAATSGKLSQFAATTSSELAGVISDETGSGALVFATSPTLVTPVLGTPTSVTLTNATGLPVASGISGLGTGVATFLATPSSANLIAAVTDETGSGSLVFGTTPTFTTNITSPLVIGGTGTTSTLTLKTTSGVGTTNADMIFQVGNDGATEVMRILNAGRVGIGTASPSSSSKLHVSGDNIRQETSGDGKGYDGYASTTHIFSLQRVTNDTRLAAYGQLLFRVNATTGPTTGQHALTIATDATATFTAGICRTIATKTADFTVSAFDTHLICDKAGTLTVTLPAASSYRGREIYLRTITANTVVSASSNVVPSTGGAAGTAILAATAGKSAILVSDGTNWQIMMAN